MAPKRAEDPIPTERRAAPGRVIRAGLLVLGASLVLVFLPALWGEWGLNKYLVAAGLLGTCLALTLLLNGAWDWVLARRRRR